MLTLENKKFRIKINEDNGGTLSLAASNDPDKMNWLAGPGIFGLPCVIPQRCSDHNITYSPAKPVAFVKSEQLSDRVVSIYNEKRMRIEVTKGFKENGNYFENYKFINNLADEEFFCRGDIGITANFSDMYHNAEYALKHCCNAHIWCGENSSYVQMLRMGPSDINIGMVVTKGDLSCYSVDKKADFTNGQIKCRTKRGLFILHPGPLVLNTSDGYELEFEFFTYKDTADFFERLKKYDSYIHITSPAFTALGDSPMEFKAEYSGGIKSASVKLNGRDIPFIKSEKSIEVCYKTEAIGQYRFDIEINGIKTHTRLMHMCKTEELIKKRAEFIVENQQYLCKGSHLDGAYMIYDNEDGNIYYDQIYPCHNASTERLGMAFAVCAYLRRHDDEKIKRSLKKFADFYEREIYDPETGVVYYGVRREYTKRLYNAPWVTTLMSEFYYIFKDKRYLEIMMKMFRVYYDIGGYKFYPNGILMYQDVAALKDAGMYKEAEELLGMFRKHVDTILANDINYPPHEVVFEQTIVSPVVAFSSQMFLLTGEEKYREEAKRHLQYLLRFNGSQPDCHLHHHPVRYWDVFYAGKTGLAGDTFPHYWSCLTAWAQKCCADAWENEAWKDYAYEEMRNCYCLYNDKFEGTCGHLFPFMIDSIRCEKDDPWSNDQDFVIYFASKIFGM